MYLKLCISKSFRNSFALFLWIRFLFNFWRFIWADEIPRDILKRIETASFDLF